MTGSNSVQTGLELPFVHDIKALVASKSDVGVNFFVTSLFHPRFRRDALGISVLRDGPETRSDRELASRDWISNFVGKISEWIDPDAESELTRLSSVRALKQEIAWAIHLSLHTVLLPTPRLDTTVYAQSLLQISTNSSYQLLCVRIPLILPLSFAYKLNENELVPGSDSPYVKDGWLVWDSLRRNCGDAFRMSVALEMSAECEDLTDEQYGSFVGRWCAEPLKVLILPVSLFLMNQSGFPVLSKRLQQILTTLLPHCSNIVFKGRSHDPSNSFLQYSQYIGYLKSKILKEMTEAEKYVSGYEDTLQSPLQPLMDNLESQTYETFERDPVKYIQYEEAIYRALIYLQRKRIEESLGSSQVSGSSNRIELVLTVVGAGRGPLVAAALSASCKASVSVRIYAVEKNCNAVITLRNRIRTENWSNVMLIPQDMRDWVPEELCDIMVSELLGSFGDNELSPECLDGAQKCLKVDGISIPKDYTSYIAPIASAKLWNGANYMSAVINNGVPTSGLDTAYVVKMHSVFQFAKAEPLFRFVHPNFSHKDPNTGKFDNSR